MRDEPMNVTLARIETKLDDVIESRKDQETRIRSLEDWRARARGVTVACTCLASAAGTIVGLYIAYFTRKAGP